MDGELAQIWGSVTETLAAAAADPAHPMRFAALASVSVAAAVPAGAAAGGRVRMVVLRAWEENPPSVDVYTDTRSPKWQELGGQPQTELLLWDPAAGLQLRLGGQIQRHAGDALARAAWDGLGEGSRRAWALSAAPGAPMAQAGARLRPPQEGWQDFGVLRLHVARVDYLRLLRRPQGNGNGNGNGNGGGGPPQARDAAGQLRAGFTFGAPGWRGMWLAP